MERNGTVPQGVPTLPLLRANNLASVPNVCHAFTTRLGGVSPAPCDALNLGGSTVDPPANVAANVRLAAAALGRDPEGFRGMRQVHGVRVVERGAGAADAALLPEADAQLTATPGLTLVALAADCVPLLLAAPAGVAVACAHAGWRGTAAGVAPAAARALAARAGCTPTDLTVALGPSIGPCCFAVGEDVARQLAAAAPKGCFAEAYVQRAGMGQLRVDLRRLNVGLLEACGVRPANIETVACCTVCDPRFFSHRRDAGRTGRQAALIGLTA